MNSLRKIDIKYLKGVGPKRAELLNKELGIKTFYDLLHHFPSHYIDRSSIYKISDLNGDMPYVQLRGRFVSFNTVGEGARARLVAAFSDGTGLMEVVWFNSIKKIKQAYLVGNEYILFGKPSVFNGRWNIVHPEVDNVESVSAAQGLRGIYPLTEKLRNSGITSRTIFTLVQTAIAGIKTFKETDRRAHV